MRALMDGVDGFSGLSRISSSGWMFWPVSIVWPLVWRRISPSTH
jgi:hypothetical protein